MPSPLFRTSQQAGSTSTIEQAEDTNASDESQVSFPYTCNNNTIHRTVTPIYAAENHSEGPRPRTLAGIPVL